MKARTATMAGGYCTVENCDGQPFCRGWCRLHYTRWRKTGDPLRSVFWTNQSRTGPCAVEGCTAPIRSRGYCEKHYHALRSHGDPLATERRTRFTSRGYVSVKRPRHPLANCRGWVLEHRLVAYEAGLLIDLTLVVHHRNHLRGDNRIENLAVMTRGEHTALHTQYRAGVR